MWMSSKLDFSRSSPSTYNNLFFGFYDNKACKYYINNFDFDFIFKIRFGLWVFKGMQI